MSVAFIQFRKIFLVTNISSVKTLENEVTSMRSFSMRKMKMVKCDYDLCCIYWFFTHSNPTRRFPLLLSLLSQFHSSFLGQIPSHEKILLQMLFGAFHITVIVLPLVFYHSIIHKTPLMAREIISSEEYQTSKCQKTDKLIEFSILDLAKNSPLLIDFDSISLFFVE